MLILNIYLLKLGGLKLKKNCPFFFVILIFFLMPSTKVKAATATANNTATFNLIENTAGLSVSAENLNFGTHEGVQGEITAISKNDISVITSEYSGKRTGWKLSVTLDKFIDSTSNKEIKGASLFYPKVTPINNEGISNAYAPISNGNTNSFFYSVLGTTVTQNDMGSSTPIASAEKGKGYGNWEFQYKGENRIQLKIPANQQVGNYTAIVTYSISDSP